MRMGQECGEDYEELYCVVPRVLAHNCSQVLSTVSGQPGKSSTLFVVELHRKRRFTVL
jgi:hypothetical protein